MQAQQSRNRRRQQSNHNKRGIIATSSSRAAQEVEEETQGIPPMAGHKIIDMPSSDGGKGTQNPVVRLMEEIEAETENY